MERLLKLYPGDLIVRMLTTQYRMHEDIMKWPSDQLYESRLKAHHSVKSHLLRLAFIASPRMLQGKDIFKSGYFKLL